MTIVAIYARVSKRDQHPENQLLELRAYAKRQKYKVFKEYVDRMCGALDSRPKLNDLLEDARHGKFDMIINWKIDRFGRSLQHLLQMLEEMQKRKIDLVFTTQNIDTSTANGKLFFQIFGAFAEFEREMIRERIFLGLERARGQGKHCGRPAGSKDKKPRRKSGYNLRWAGKKPSPLKQSRRSSRKTNDKLTVGCL
jgi:DNA invertase Pin-like site-specific DNA recombinase